MNSWGPPASTRQRYVNEAMGRSFAISDAHRVHDNRRTRIVQRIALPPFIGLIIASTFLPEAFSFFVVGLRLTVTRVALLLLAPLLVVLFAQKVTAGRYRLVLSDLLVMLAGGWMFIGPGATEGILDALRHSGPVALEFCIGYWSTRLLLSKHGHALSAIGWLCGVISVVALLGMLDSMRHHYVVHEWASALTGYNGYHGVFAWSPGRLGFLRAKGPLEHPIAFGFACGVGLLLAAAVRMFGRVLKVIACAMGALASFSSAPLQGVILGVVLLVYDRFLGRVRGRWVGLIVLSAVAGTIIILSFEAPILYIIEHFTFDPGTGLERLHQWNVVGEVLYTSPWFGLGYQDPATSSGETVADLGSVDSLWLVAALAYGIPSSVLIALTLIGSTSLPVKGPRVGLSRDEAKLGTVLSTLMCITVFMGFTVHIWGTDWILISLLAGVRAHLGELGRIERRQVVTPFALNAVRQKDRYVIVPAQELIP
jgi:hypothetical protein